MVLKTFMSTHKQQFDEAVLTEIDQISCPTSLKQSMRYSLEVGGKRMRPLLLFAVLESTKTPISIGMKTAIALEMIHTYSLIHDDLPAMDDDELRRGMPTNHIKFGEATAILAGDGLLTAAFELIASDEQLSGEQRVRLITMLSRAAGPSGMIAGQVMDIEATSQQVSLQQLKEIHECKTGRLIEFAVLAGALLARCSTEETTWLQAYARHIGLAFQIKDDILDVEGETELIGKTVGSDVANHKSTYVALTSLPRAKEMLQLEIDQAVAALSKTTLNPNLLTELASYIQNRQL